MCRGEKFLGFVLGAVFLTALCFGQTRDRAELGGRVTDESGGALPGVSLLLRNEATAHEQTRVSGDTGDFVFPFVPTAATP